MRILRELDRGRSYIPIINDRQPETFFTFPALYEDLPAYRRDLFVGGDGEALDVDLYDAGAWTRYGWSALSRRGTTSARALGRGEPVRHRGAARRLPALDAGSSAEIPTRAAGGRRLVASAALSPHSGQERPHDSRASSSVFSFEMILTPEASAAVAAALDE